MESAFQRSTTVKYVSALLLVGILSFCAYFMTYQGTLSQKSTAAIVNAAGRRRMTSQQIVYYAHLLITDTDPQTRELAKTKLDEALKKYETNHRGLLHGDKELGLSGELSPTMHDFYYSADSNLNGLSDQFTTQAHEILDGKSRTREELKALADLGTGPLIEKLNKAVGMYQVESEKVITHLNEIESLVLLATLFLLGAEAFFIFRPLTSSLTRMITRVQEQRGAVQRLLDNAGQGFLSIDPAGKIGEQYSKTVEMLFDTVPSGKHIATLLGQSEESWNGYISVLFNENVPFESLVAVCPRLVTIGERIVELDYKQVRNLEGVLTQIMMIGTDVTVLKATERKADQERQTNRALLAILGSKNQFIDILDMLRVLSTQVSNEAETKRLLHTLKGGFAFFECKDVARLCHAWEEKMKAGFSQTIAKQAHDEISAEVQTFLSKYEKVLGLGESRKKTVRLELSRIDEALTTATKLRAPAGVLSSIESLKAQPIDEALSWLNEAFQSAARDLKKETAPIVWKSNTMIVADDYKALFMSLIHVVRNTADHGIEAPLTRTKAGKPRKGQLTVSLEQAGDFMRLKFRDDGAGVDVDRVRAKAKSLGILGANQTDEAILDFLFHPGFSTQDQVSEISGRGVGLSAVRIEAQALGGDARAVNYPGQGLEIEVWVRRLNVSQAAA